MLNSLPDFKSSAFMTKLDLILGVVGGITLFINNYKMGSIKGLVRFMSLDVIFYNSYLLNKNRNTTLPTVRLNKGSQTLL